MTCLPALSRALRPVLGEGIGLGLADPRAPAPQLWPEEEAATARMVPARRREFAAGRAAARAAMADLGLPPAAVPMGSDRAPVWPAELVGSISHCAGAAIAVVAPRHRAAALGIDIEEGTPLDAELVAEILTRSERDWVMRQAEALRGHHAKQIFCAKETVYKAQYPQTGRVLGFDEVTLTLEGARFQARLPYSAHAALETLDGDIVRSGGLVAAVCSVPARSFKTGDHA